MIHAILGTRAQAIKMAPVLKGLQDKGIPYNFILLAQHKETLAEILDQFGVKPPDTVIEDWGKDITRTREMVLWSLKVLAGGWRNRNRIFKGDRSGVVLIHGDAPPLLLGGLLAKFQGLKVAQIEAGLRSFNLLKPFPEELTRVLASRLGVIDIFFCQDDKAVRNVDAYKRETHHTRFNTLLDALRLADNGNGGSAAPVNGSRKTFALVTLHRYETIARRSTLARAVDRVTRIARTLPLKFILHPPTRVALKKCSLYETLERHPRIELLPRLDFFAFSRMLRKAEFIVSDGGSNQEECHYLGIPCLLLREETERVEGLGENAVLSRFDENLIDDFVHRYPEFRRAPLTDTASPTEIILDRLAPYHENSRHES